MLKYRSEIDGLRALAVIPVILFHAGIPLFDGGFVGVDIFFVISGYLITSIICSDLRDGSFSLVKFYERRARRILPALFLVMLVCIPVTWFWLLPRDMEDFSQSLIAVPTFVSNILFWRESGYFEPAAELKPLLHTWSLAVEEQFYLLFPIFLFSIWKLGEKWIKTILLIVVAMSLLLSQYGLFWQPTATFFLLPSRAWELAIGSLLALYRFNKAVPSEGGKYEILSLVGLALILVSIFGFDHDTPFPGVYALVPTIGASLIVMYAIPRTTVGRILGSRLFVGIGLISYSAYLWHQPLFSFLRRRNLVEESQVYTFFLMSIVTLILAYLTWRFVEQPFRDSKKFNRNSVFSLALCGSVLFISFGVMGVLSNGFEHRELLPAPVIESLQRSSRTEECFDKTSVHIRSDWLCEIGDTNVNASFMVLGDSHSIAFLDPLGEVAKAEGQSGLYTGLSGCPPLLGLYSLRGDQTERDCNLLNRRVFDYVNTSDIKKIMLISRWTYYTDGGYTGVDFSYLGLSPNDRKEKQLSRAAFEHGLELTVASYISIGVEVYLIEQAPQQEFSPQEMYLVAKKNGLISLEELERLSVGFNKHLALQAYVSSEFAKYSEEIHRLSLDSVFCDAIKCSVGNENGSYYFDDDHLSRLGAQKTIPILMKVFD